MVGSEFSAFYFEGSPVLFGDKIFQSRQPLCFFLNIPSLQLVFNPKTPKNILLIYFMTLIICKGPRDLFAITKVSFWPYLTWKISPLVVYFLPKTFNVFKSVTAIDLNHSSYMLVHWKIIDEITFQVGSLSHWKLLVLLGGLFGINFNIFSFPCLLL